jgi:hypothetical protein
MKTIRISTLGVADDYGNSLVPLIIKSLGFKIEWVSTLKADLIIFGPFYKTTISPRWAPKLLRPILKQLTDRMVSTNRPVTLFHTSENLRHDYLLCDYALSFDLGVENSRHCRLPYWMEMVNWEHEGIVGNENIRFGRVLELDRLMRPLGEAFLQKPRQAALFASHMREPRSSLMKAVAKLIPVQGFGPAFDKNIAHHLHSGFSKENHLKNFAFNLCPENSMYPGYYTEKVPEAFMADCLPLAWADSNVKIDFNPKAIVNLADMMSNGFENLADLLLSNRELAQYSEQALLTEKPSLWYIQKFLLNIVKVATS